MRRHRSQGDVSLLTGSKHIAVGFGIKEPPEPTPTYLRTHSLTTIFQTPAITPTADINTTPRRTLAPAANHCPWIAISN